MKSSIVAKVTDFVLLFNVQQISLLFKATPISPFSHIREKIK